jgi:hypothetical protein
VLYFPCYAAITPAICSHFTADSVQCLLHRATNLYGRFPANRDTIADRQLDAHRDADGDRNACTPHCHRDSDLDTDRYRDPASANPYCDIHARANRHRHATSRRSVAGPIRPARPPRWCYLLQR